MVTYCMSSRGDINKQNYRDVILPTTNLTLVNRLNQSNLTITGVGATGAGRVELEDRGDWRLSHGLSNVTLTKPVTEIRE